MSKQRFSGQAVCERCGRVLPYACLISHKDGLFCNMCCNKLDKKRPRTNCSSDGMTIRIGALFSNKGTSTV